MQIDSKKLTPEISEKYTVLNNTFLATPKEIRFGNWFGFSSFYESMVDGVLPSFLKEIKIFNSVVRMNFVDMVNNLVSKMASKVFFNYKSVFRNISLLVSKRMLRRFDFDIPLTRDSFSAIPVIMFFPRIISSFSFIPRRVALLKFRHEFKVNDYNLSITHRLELSNLYR